MRRILPLALALLAAGCLGDEGRTGGNESVRNGAAPVEVYDATLDFSGDPSGARRETALDMPPGARHFTFTVTWEGQPAGPTADVAIVMVDGQGNEVASCRLGTGAVTSTGRDCGPQTNMADRGPYKLTWEGFGAVKAHVTIIASFPQE
jgi:hypothetical protein